MRNGRSRTALLVMGAAGLAAGAIVLSPAAAGKNAVARDVIGSSHGLKYAVEQTTITDPGGHLVVDCPGASAPTGGGTFIETEDPEDAQITNSTPQPAGDPSQKPDEGWLSEGRLAPTLGSTSLLAYAICSDRPSKLRYRSEAEFVAGTEFTGVDCPGGTALTGGGALTDGNLDDMTLVASHPFPKQNPTGWAAGAKNHDTAQHSLVAYAICSKEKGKYSSRFAKVDIPTAPPAVPTRW